MIIPLRESPFSNVPALLFTRVYVCVCITRGCVDFCTFRENASANVRRQLPLVCYIRPFERLQISHIASPKNIEIPTSHDHRVAIARFDRACVFRKIDLALTRRNYWGSRTAGPPPSYRGDSILDCVLTTGIKLAGSHYSRRALALRSMQIGGVWTRARK